jgi:hypothetical protein
MLLPFLTVDQIVQLTPDQIVQLTPDRIGSLNCGSDTLQSLTIDQITQLTSSQIGILALQCHSNNTNGDSYGEFSYVVTKRLIAPILNPSGIWADFNTVNRYYQKIISTPGLIPVEYLPSPPNPADYADLTSPKSTIWVNWGSLSNQIN